MIEKNWILQNINELIGNANLWYSIFYKFAVKNEYRYYSK